MQTQTTITHNFHSPQDFVSNVADELFKNHLRPYLENLQTAPPENKLRTRLQTANRLNIALSTLHFYTRTGKITAQRIGGRVLYSDDAINQALKTIKT